MVIGACLLLAALAWGLRAPLHDLPLERDEGAYATIATRWLAGDTLYRNLFDHKPPLLYLVFALARLLPGGHVRAIREFATLYLLASGLALFGLGRLLYGRLAALAALALFLAYGSSVRFQGLIFNSEAVLVLPAILGCLLVVCAMRQRRVVLFGLAGVCVGLATATKPVGALLLAPLLLAPLLVDWPRRRQLAAIGLGFGGALLPSALFALMLWREGALAAAYEALISYNLLYAADSAAYDWDLTVLWYMWWPMLALALPAVAGLAVGWTRRAWRTPAHCVAVLWGLALLATALLSLRAYPHYYLAAVPLLSLWAGSGIVALGGFIRGGRLWLAPLLVLALLAPPVLEVWPLRAQSPREQIGTLYGRDGAQFFAYAADVARYAAARTKRGQSIFVWAAEPEIYYLAGFRPATRFVYDYPIERIPGAHDEVLSALRQELPRMIVTYHTVRPMGFHPFMFDYGYRLRITIGGYDIYQRP